MDVSGEFARSRGVSLPLFEASAPLYAEALRAGLGDQETAAVFAVLDRRRPETTT